MNSSTSGLFQNRIQYPSSLSTMNPVKTANPIIFPSLHPMSNFYKQKQDIHSAKNADSQATYKKVKCENGSQQVRTTFNAPIISKSIVKEPVKQAVNDTFRVPNLPKRLNSPTNTQLTKIENVNIPENFGATSEPLVIPDNIKIEWKAPQMSNQQALPQRNKANNISQPQINLQLLNQVYENLKMEFYAFQLKQNLAQMQQQRQQEVLGQALKQILMTKPSEGKEFAKQRKRSSSIDTDTDSIKEENVKQEIAL